MSDFNKLIVAFEKASCSGGVLPEVVADAEKSLGVCFPVSYKQFLYHFGAVSLGGCEIAGLFTNQANSMLWLNVVTSTNQIRRALQGRLSQRIVYISDNGGDIKYFLDTSHMNGTEECPVIALGPGADYVIVASNFFEFAIKLVTDSLSI